MVLTGQRLCVTPQWCVFTSGTHYLVRMTFDMTFDLTCLLQPIRHFEAFTFTGLMTDRQSLHQYFNTLPAASLHTIKQRPCPIIVFTLKTVSSPEQPSLYFFS